MLLRDPKTERQFIAACKALSICHVCGQPIPREWNYEYGCEGNFHFQIGSETHKIIIEQEKEALKR